MKTEKKYYIQEKKDNWFVRKYYDIYLFFKYGIKEMKEYQDSGFGIILRLLFLFFFLPMGTYIFGLTIGYILNLIFGWGGVTDITELYH